MRRTPIHKKIIHKIKKIFLPKAIVLMYHRIAQSKYDVWDMNVSAANFEQHLQFLQKTGKVISLKELVEDVKNKSIKKNSIAITFDDGYADNYHTAKPLLEKYNLPATFFITSANIEKQQEFWWDELEHLILHTEKLPSSLSLNINNTPFEFVLENESRLTPELLHKYTLWKASEQAPGTLRCEIFLKLWQALKPLPAEKQQKILDVISEWAGCSRPIRYEYLCMTQEQLQDLATQELFSVGIHTVNHASLPSHNNAYQKKELLENKNYLENITRDKAEILAYPYGDFNDKAISAAAEIELKAAFTTNEVAIRKRSPYLELGRFHVKNQNYAVFKKTMKSWLKK